MTNIHSVKITTDKSILDKDFDGIAELCVSDNGVPEARISPDFPVELHVEAYRIEHEHKTKFVVGVRLKLRANPA